MGGGKIGSPNSPITRKKGERVPSPYIIRQPARKKKGQKKKGEKRLPEFGDHGGGEEKKKNVFGKKRKKKKKRGFVNDDRRTRR